MKATTSTPRLRFSERYLRRLLCAWVILTVLVFARPNTILANDESSVDLPAASYVVACPFETIPDRISRFDFFALWKKNRSPIPELRRLRATPETIDVFESRYGTPNPRSVQLISDLPDAFTEYGTCWLLPVVALRPDLKVIRIGDTPFPWANDYDATTDLFAFSSDDATLIFDRTRVSRVLLTGTTALTRTTAYQMAQHGMTWPGEAIRTIFADADIRHISNESSFWSSCPAPRPSQTMQFCSPVNGWELFRDLDVTVIEMTGNHLRDYDWSPLVETFEIFERENFPYYGAGRTVTDANRPYEITHNGNRFIFRGCNIAGPEHVYVSDDLPGVNRCDFEQLAGEIREDRRNGKLPIVTLQYYEVYSRVPSEIQTRDFRALSDAGAIVLSGSQAHYAQTYAVAPDRIIHYGPGNLFFDQMDQPIQGTRQELLDQYVFYDGRLLTLEIHTALLTDWGKPVPMNATERAGFLSEILPKTERLNLPNANQL